MRFINRRDVRAPSILFGAEADRFRGEVTTYFDQDIREYRSSPPPLTVLDDPELRSSLRILFDGACAYCELPLREDEEQVDHFRPWNGAEREDGHVDFRHYCWLGLDWDNLYLACPACLRAKRDRFPVARSGHLRDGISALREFEEGTLLDPCHDLPAAHLEIREDGYFAGIQPRGQLTINVLNLNRPDLVERRAQHVHELMENYQRHRAGDPWRWRREFRWPDHFRGTTWLWLLERLPDVISRSFRDRRPGRGRQARLLQEVARRGGGDYRPHGPAPVRLRERRFIRRVEIQNFRGIESMVIEFPQAGKRSRKGTGSIAVLGDNGVGKTSLLQAIALGALGAAKANATSITPEWCLKEGAASGRIVVEFFDTREQNWISFERGAKSFVGDEQIDVVVLGYGSYRLPSRALTDEGRRFDYRIDSLFDERATVNGPYGLMHHRRAYPPNDSVRLEDAGRTLNSLLPKGADAKIEGSGRLVIHDHGRAQSLTELSSGYKSIVTIAADVMNVLYELWDGTTAGQALILVDEIDAHLHPAWRLTVMDALRTAFPLSQFVVTTHDPLVLRGLEQQEVLILDREAGPPTYYVPTVSPIESLSVDQLLTSELFGLVTTLDPILSETFARYYELLSIRERGPAQEEELAAIEAHLPPTNPKGETRRERPLYAIIDRYLARHRENRRADVWDEASVTELSQAFEQAEEEAADDLPPA